jgi:hypothetical protein
MNVFTLTAAGLVALGVPLAAPWLAQESAPTANTAPLAPAQVIDLRGAFASTTTEPAPLAVLSTSSFTPASTQDAPAPARVRALAPDLMFPATTGALLAPQDEAARQIAELQARIAALQVEVAALSAHQAHGTIAATLDAAGFETRVYEEPRVAEELHRERAAQERSGVERQMEGERRRAEREVERARATIDEELRRRTELEFARRMQEFEQQHARHADALATLEARIAEHEAAMAGIDAEFANGELSPRRQERLEERREELQERIEEIYEEIDEQHEIFEEALDEYEEQAWTEESMSVDSGDFFGALGGLGYVDTQASEECETEEVAIGGAFDTAWLDESEAGLLALDFPAVTTEAGEERQRSFSFRKSFGPEDGAQAMPRSSNGDVIVNVGGGGGGHDAQIVDLLREIRDEVRALRADLRSLHGATPPPTAPRASRRGDFGYAPNSTTGPGVASGFDTYAPSALLGGADAVEPGTPPTDPFGGNPGGAYGGSFPASGGAFAPSTSGGGEAFGGGFSGAGFAPSFGDAPAVGTPANPFAPNSNPVTGSAGFAPTGAGRGSLR